MNSIRVHSALPEDREQIAYLVLAFVDSSRVSFDFAGFGAGAPVAAPVTLSHQALYEILRGHVLTTAGSCGTIQFAAQGDELVIRIAMEDAKAAREYHVWLSEVALGWNILSRRAGNPA